MKPSKVAPLPKPADTGPSSDGAAPRAAKSESKGKPSSKRSATQGEKKSTP